MGIKRLVRWLLCVAVLPVLIVSRDASIAVAQTETRARARVQAPVRMSPMQLAILRAEDRRAATMEELATIRGGLRDADGRTVRMAVRALGRLERPVLIGDIVPRLEHRDAAVRAEAATAVGQAAQGWKRDAPAGWERRLEAVQAALGARLLDERDPAVRVALCDSIGRLPYVSAAQVERAERVLVAAAPRGRFGVAIGLFRLTRFRNLHPLGTEARAVLAGLIPVRADAGVAARPAVLGAQRGSAMGAADAARVRRVALEAYLALGPIGTRGAGERSLIEAAARDADAQVRRLAVRGAAGAANHEAAAVVKAAVGDASPIVRVEALRGLVPGGVTVQDACGLLVKALDDQAVPVALMAMDELSRCGASAEAVEAMARAAGDVQGATAAPRAWHRAAHALTSLATAAPDRAAALLGPFASASIWQLRMYAARAAEILKQREMLEKLASDADDNVREVAIDALARLYGHDADTVFLAQLARTGNQVLRSAALALAGTPRGDEARAPLRSTLQRLIAEGRDNSHDARTAIAKALDGLGERSVSEPNPADRARIAKADDAGAANGARAAAGAGSASPASLADSLRLSTVTSELDTADAAATLRRLAAARVRVTLRGVGAFELMLLPEEAPASVLRFARLAESGYYNGLTFHRVVPNFVLQGGSPGANEYVGDAAFMRDEVGVLPHVRGAVGVSTRGRDTGDGQIFVNLVDIPRLDHDYTVFAHVTSGLDVIDRVLEGDVIERIEIINGNGKADSNGNARKSP